MANRRYVVRLNHLDPNVEAEFAPRRTCSAIVIPSPDLTSQSDSFSPTRNRTTATDWTVHLDMIVVTVGTWLEFPMQDSEANPPIHTWLQYREYGLPIVLFLLASRTS